MDIIGKTVAIKDKSMLTFFYPQFIVKDVVLFDRENSVIYTGPIKRDLNSFLANNTKEFINTVGVAEIDLDSRKNMVEFVFSKHNKTVKQDILDILDALPEEEYWNFVKTMWVCGKSIISEESDLTIFSLYRVIGKSKNDVNRIFLQLLDNYEIGTLESCILTFLEKSALFDQMGIKGSYLKILSEFHDKYGSKVQAVLRKYTEMDYPKELKLLWLLWQF